MASGTLTGQTIANTYKSLLKITGTTAGGETLHATNQIVIEDGDGNPFPLSAAQDALMITSTNRLEFGDTGTYIFQSADGVLDLVSDTEVEINGALIDINSSGAMTLDGADDSNITVAGSNKDLAIAVSGGSTQTLTMSSAGTGANAIGITASAGGVTMALGGGAGDDFIVDTNTLVVESDNNRVGIGTAAPTQKLHVYNGSSGVTPHALSFISVENSASVYLQTLTPNDESGGILFSDPQGQSGSIAYNHNTDDMTIAAADDINFAFGDNLLLGDGTGKKVGIGSTSYFQKFSIFGQTATLAEVAAISFFSNSSTSDHSWTIANGSLGNNTTGAYGILGFCAGDDTNDQNLNNPLGANSDPVFSLNANGRTVRIHALTSVTDLRTDSDGVLIDGSDENLKKNIVQINDALAKVNAMRGVYFDWKSEADGNTYCNMTGEGKQIGLIAQEVKVAVPELAYTHGLDENGNGTIENYPDGIQSVRYGQTVGLIVEAIKELTTKVTALENA